LIGGHCVWAGCGSDVISCATTSLLTNLTRVPGAIVSVDGLAPAVVIVITTTEGGGGGGGAGAVNVNPPLSPPLRPFVLVTVTSTALAVRAGVVAVIDVTLTTTTLDAAVPPKETVAPAANPVPDSVTVVPPAVVPDVGAIAVTVGATGAGGGGGGGCAEMYVKPRNRLPLCPSGFVTTTSTLPALPAGAVAVIDVALATFTAVADVGPNATVAPDANPAPVMVTLVPPAAGPEDGPIDETDGGALAGNSYLNPSVRRPLWPSGFVTTMSAAPAERAGVVAVIDVALATWIPVAAAPPMVTVAPATKPVPVMVTASPPVVVPNDGAMVDNVGAGAVEGGGCEEGPAGLDPPQDQPNAASNAHAAKRRTVGL
jgi:hypothetical protein